MSTRLAQNLRCHDLHLVREGWRGRAALAWVPAEQYAALAARAAELLGPRERRTFDGYEHPRRRISYLLGRCAAKAALEQLVGGLDSRTVDVLPGCFQQPVVQARLEAPVGVSISHSAQAACAVAFPEEHPMGIDVEEIEAERAAVMRTQFVEREITAIGRLGGETPLSTVVWTAKEALSKVLRCGMTVPFELLEVDALASHDAGASGRFRHFVQYRFQSWISASCVVSLVLPRNTRLDGEPPCPLPSP